MRPPNRNKRLLWIGILGTMLISGVFVIFTALNENTQFFFNPADVAQANIAPNQVVRIGGLVVEGSVEKPGDLVTTFEVKDFERDMPLPIRVRYEGALPDLFREGQGIVMTGTLQPGLAFEATEVLAKHDENYQPKINYEDEKP